MSHYLPRVASPQAWRRLRKAMTDQELKDITRDIVHVCIVDVSAVSDMDPETLKNLTGTILFALSSKNWETK